MRLQRAYRPDIDGLRGVAVLAILFYHIGWDWAPGGFVGVDVFFVISGFLITRNILYDIGAGKFTFKRFYVKRIRRLFPALFLTLAVTLSVGIWLFSPAELERLAQSTLYALFSVSNFFFWGESGYFNPDAFTKPLLHTWSLGVEEQYYLIWPSIVLGLTLIRKPVALASVLLALCGLSLALNIGFIDTEPEAVFFLLPFRVFEFVFGAACVWITINAPLGGKLSELAVITGLAMIAWAVANYDHSIPFPGINALLPCAGAALVILGGKAVYSGRLLRARLLVGIGLISYSVYLLHWPLIVYYRYLTMQEMNGLQQSILLLIALLGGWLMWRFVEQPFRSKGAFSKTAWGQKLVWVPLSMSVLIVAAGATWANKGFPGRYPNELFMSSKQIAAERSRYWKQVTNKDSRLLQGDPDAKHVIVMGNSHAIDLVYALRGAGSRIDFDFLNTSHRCFNFGTPRTEQDAALCSQLLEQNYHAAWDGVDAVYLHDSWSRFDGPDLRKRLLEIRALTDAPIYVFGPKMTFRKDVLAIARAHMRLQTLNEYGMRFAFRKNRKQINDSLRHLLADDFFRKRNIFFVDVLSAQCGESIEACDILSDDGKFMYFDAEHFSREGAMIAGLKIRRLYPELF
ncbi:acyltransferase family protein [Thiolapillus brandeum]|uniref:Acyltransferase family protein n=1 Tax=Thiolapillus brandeum TaxID=1076588 RepID=A0A7U6GG77_9GAMM|nr:acyltransferase family protein [Thiolapillus brandeum]BAO43019.1 acyltransferase family protein [Thiolapillus brandeum]